MRLSDLCAAAAVSLVLVACGPDRSDASTAPASTAPASTASATTAAGGQGGKAAPGPAAGAADGAGSALPKATNTRDPIDGLPVDPTIPPVVVDISVVYPPMTVVIGVSNADNAKRIKSDPDKYAAAAQHNGVARQETDTLLPK